MLMFDITMFNLSQLHYRCMCLRSFNINYTMAVFKLTYVLCCILSTVRIFQMDIKTVNGNSQHMGMHEYTYLHQVQNTNYVLHSQLVS